MQRPPLFESDGFIYLKNRFETYVKSKDLDLWHVIIYGDFPPTQNNPETKKDEIIPFDKQSDDLKKRLAKNNEATMVIYNALPQEKSIDNAFARFNTIITSLKALDEGFSSKNYVRKFLRVLHPKWHAKVIGKREQSRSLALKAKKESSDEESLTSKSEDEESHSKEIKMTRMVRAKENALDVEIQITSSENVRSHQEDKTKGLLLEDLGAIAAKMRKKRLKTKCVLWLKHLIRSAWE
ncbi:hypothetical protein Tco_0650067 [Tanacetum coccineum]